jgi:hypothetical protein
MHNKSFRLTFSLLISAGIITACSQQAPNLAGNQNSNSTVNQDGNVAGTSVQSTETQDIIASNQDDETTISDSDVVAQSEGGFAVQGVKEDIKEQKQDLKEDVKEQHQELKDDIKDLKETFKEREDRLMDRINNLGQQLKALKDFDKNKLNKLRRRNVDVKTSNTIEIKNSDGTTTKVIDIKFQNQNDVTTRESKLSNTFDASGRLISSEYYLTVTTNAFTRTYLKMVNYNANGSKNVSVRSETRWTSGKIRTVNETRTIDANGNGTGSGTVVITMPNGQTTTFNFNFTISGNTIITVPNPVPTPFPTFSPTPVATATPVSGNGFLRGIVSIGPLCPVEPCNLSNGQLESVYASRKITVYNQSRTSIVAEFHADVNGNYNIQLPAGTYVIDTEHAAVGSSNLPQTVQINAGATTTLNITIDTGIR